MFLPLSVNALSFVHSFVVRPVLPAPAERKKENKRRKGGMGGRRRHAATTQGLRYLVREVYAQNGIATAHRRTWSAVSNLTPRAGEQEAHLAGRMDRYRVMGKTREPLALKGVRVRREGAIK